MNIKDKIIVILLYILILVITYLTYFSTNINNDMSKEFRTYAVDGLYTTKHVDCNYSKIFKDNEIKIIMCYTFKDIKTNKIITLNKKPRIELSIIPNVEFSLFRCVMLIICRLIFTTVSLVTTILFIGVIIEGKKNE